MTSKNCFGCKLILQGRPFILIRVSLHYGSTLKDFCNKKCHFDWKTRRKNRLKIKEKMITITKTDANILAGVWWVCQAVAKRDFARSALQYVKVEHSEGKTKFVGCDGRRLHIFTTKKFTCKPDVYSITECTKSTIVLTGETIDANRNPVVYPDYNKTIPDPSCVITTAKMEPKNLTYNFANVVKKMDDEYSVDFLLFKQLTAINKEDFKLMLALRGGIRYIIIKQGGYFGLVMPIKLQQELEWQD